NNQIALSPQRPPHPSKWGHQGEEGCGGEGQFRLVLLFMVSLVASQSVCFAQPTNAPDTNQAKPPAAPAPAPPLVAPGVPPATPVTDFSSRPTEFGPATNVLEIVPLI